MVILSWYRFWYLELVLILPAIMIISFLLVPPKATLPEPGSSKVQAELASDFDKNLIIKPLEDQAQVELVGAEESEPRKASSHPGNYSKLYRGKIGNFPVTMTIFYSDGDITGNYYYDKVKKPITLKGTVNSAGIYQWYENKCTVSELAVNGEESAKFTGVLTDFEFFGSWSDGKRSYPFSLVANDSIGNNSAKLIRNSDDRYRSEMQDGIVFYPRVKMRDRKLEKLVGNELKFEKVFDPDMKGWLGSAQYYVTYNKNNLLNLVWWVEGSGAYPSQFYKIATMNLKTGKRASVNQLFRKDRLENLARLVDKKMQSTIQIHLAENVAEEDNQFVKEELEGMHFTIENINSFSIDGDGVTFLYDFGFAHVAKACEPEGNYFFSWEELRGYLKPDGLLSPHIEQYL